MWIQIALFLIVTVTTAACSDAPVGRAGSGGNDSTSEVTGEAGGPCYPNGTCNAGLDCVDGLSINTALTVAGTTQAGANDPTAASASDTTADNTADTSPDTDRPAGRIRLRRFNVSSIFADNPFFGRST